MSNNSVADRVIIVTGAGHGIGRGLVRYLAAEGAAVVAAEWRPDYLADTIAELESAGAACLGVETDVQNRDSIYAMVNVTVERFARVDGIVNNAMTISKSKALIDVTEADVDMDFTSGVKGTLWAMQAVYPHMKKAGWGRIVNVGSSAGLVNFRGLSSYGAAKEAIRAFTRSAAREWCADGIVANVYCPVSMGVHLAEAGGNGYENFDEFTAQSMRMWEAMSPSGWDGDAATDLGPAIAFLLSDGCRFLTGQTLTLDGGAWMHA